MRYSLVIERSTEIQSAAIIKEDAAETTVIAAEKFEGSGFRGNGVWVNRLREFVLRHIKNEHEIHRIIVGTGPGSFAGIRAALAFAQGYAIGRTCEVVGLTSAAALAKGDDGVPFAVVGDARQDKFWIALFDGFKLAAKIFQVEKDILHAAIPRSAKVITPDSKRIEAVLKEVFEERYIGGAIPDAGRLAIAAINNPQLLVNEPLPIYLNPAVRN